jgi:chemotaxis protein MotB
MRIAGIKWILIGVAGFVFSGCVSQEQYNDVKAQNRIQQERISELKSKLSVCELEQEQLEKRNESLSAEVGADIMAKNEMIAALEEDIDQKKELIEKMQGQLLRSGAKLPMELNVKLQEFAKSSEMIGFDESTGMLEFASDLLFELGSDQVQADASGSISKLCEIMKSEAASEFDVIIAGHTDDVPIKKPSTLQKHPTNWHLSAHRAISVLDKLTDCGMSPERVSIRAFGEYRPEEPNKEGKKGNAANRRVEIYIVPKGA